MLIVFGRCCATNTSDFGSNSNFIWKTKMLTSLHRHPPALTLSICIGVLIASVTGCNVETYHDSTGNGGMIQVNDASLAQSFGRVNEGAFGGTSCGWTIHVPQGRAVYIIAEVFNIPKSINNDCSDASLQIFDASITPPVLHYKACGLTFDPIYRQWSSVKIRFEATEKAMTSKYGVPQVRILWRIIQWPPKLSMSSVSCGEGKFQCEITMKCVDVSSVCNKVPDCVRGNIFDYSDESEQCARSNYQMSERGRSSGGGGDWSFPQLIKSKLFIFVASLVVLLVLIVVAVALFSRFTSTHQGNSHFKPFTVSFSKLAASLTTKSNERESEQQRPPAYAESEKDSSPVVCNLPVQCFIYPKNSSVLDCDSSICTVDLLNVPYLSSFSPAPSSAQTSPLHGTSLGRKTLKVNPNQSVLQF